MGRARGGGRAAQKERQSWFGAAWKWAAGGQRPGPGSGRVGLPRPGAAGGWEGVRGPAPGCCCAALPAARSLPGRPTASRVGTARSPAEVQQRPGGGRGALCRPAEEVELRERARLLGLHVLQVEAPHQEVLAPDVLRHQVHLRRAGSEPERARPFPRLRARSLASANPPSLVSHFEFEILQEAYPTTDPPVQLCPRILAVCVTYLLLRTTGGFSTQT